MIEVHRVEVKTEVSTERNKIQAVTLATKWLLDEMGVIEELRDVEASMKDGTYSVEFRLELTGEQVDSLYDVNVP